MTGPDRPAIPSVDQPPPRVTVAVSTWNRAHLVGRAIASVLAQTFRDIEILVVDDGSTDATPQVLGRIEDCRLRIVRLDRNGGISQTRNTAIRLARGEWLAFLDDDNEWGPEYLARQLALAASHPGADVVYCRARRRDARTGRDGVVPAAIWGGRVFHHLVSGWIPLLSCALVRRSALLEVGGLDEELEASEDRDLWMRLAQRTDFAGTPDILVVRHEHEGAQLSRNYRLLARDAVVLDSKWKATIMASCGWLAYRRWRAVMVTIAEIVRAMEAAESGKRLEGLRSVGRMARHLPWSTPALARGLAVTVLGLKAYQRLALVVAAGRRRAAASAQDLARGPAFGPML